MNIKNIYEKMPYSFRLLIGYLGRIRIVTSKSFKETYKMLDEFDKYSEEKKKDIQIERLKSILVFAYEHCSYYKELFDDNQLNVYQFSSPNELEKIPYLSKEIIAEKGDRIMANDIKNFYFSVSGGTSGQPVKIAFDNLSLYKERAFVYHYWSKFGYNYKRSKLLSFREHDFNGKLSKINPMYNELIINPFLLDSINIYQIVELANKWDAEFLYGYPSVIGPFCCLLKKYDLKIRKKIKAVFLISENLYPDQKSIINEVIDAPIAMFYGHTEKSVFAEEYDEEYYFNQLYGYTEIIDSNESNIVCTGFINKKMPLIRYKVDDRAEKREKGYRIIGHRDNEFLYGENDYAVSATSIEFTHEEAFEKIQEYQFVQYETGKVELRLKPVVELTQFDLHEIEKCVQKKLPNFIISISDSNPIIRTNRGKFKLIIQNSEEN